MHFTDKQLEDFRKIYKDKFGEDLSDADTLEYATELMGMMKVIYGIDVE